MHHRAESLSELFDHLPFVHMSVPLSVCLWTFHIFIFFCRTTRPILTDLCTKHWSLTVGMFFKINSHGLFPRGDNSKIGENILRTYWSLLHKPNFNQLWHILIKLSLSEGYSSIYIYMTISFWFSNGDNDQTNLTVKLKLFGLNLDPKWALWTMGLLIIIASNLTYLSFLACVEFLL